MRKVATLSCWPLEELKEDRAKPRRCTSHREWHILRTLKSIEWG